MDAFLSTAVRGTMWGALMGLGLGSVSGILAMHKTEPPQSVTFSHPADGRQMVLQTYGLDGDAGIVGMLRRVQRTLSIEPSIRPEAARQFAVILAKTRSFYDTLKAYVDAPLDVEIRLKIKARKCATAASQAITNFEAYVWDSPEIEDIMGCLEIARKAMVDKMLTLDKH